MAERMRVVEITAPGGPEVLRPALREIPVAGAGELLVRVWCAGVNRPDVLQRQGRYPPPPGASDIPGLEVSGEVAALGEGVRDWRVGDQLCALVSGGGYAEYCLVPQAQALPVPHPVGTAESAGLPETTFTVWGNVFERAALRPGERFLVHGGSSGIGTTAIQLAAAHGAEVYATAGSEAKLAACRDLGARAAVNYRETDFASAIDELTGGAGVDVILDMVGGDYTARNLALLAPEGRLVQIAFLRGAAVQIDLEPIMRKRLVLTGSTLRARAPEVKAALAEALRREVWPWIAAGRMRPVIHATFPLAEAAEAHRVLDGGEHIGKLLLDCRL